MSTRVPKPRPVSAKAAAAKVLRDDVKLRDTAAKKLEPSLGTVTRDSFQSFAFKMGVGTDSPLSKSSFGFNPITRDRTLLEWAYRGSWVCGKAIDTIADDMTRKGVLQKGTLQPTDIQRIEAAHTAMNVWGGIRDAIRWSRLYGGGLAVILIDGQDPATELKIDRIAPGSFRGVLALGRWEVEPSMENLIQELGPNLGLPRYYNISAAAAGLPQMKIHHTRCIRLEGVRMPYQQRLSENMWGISILERIYDRLLGFEWATTGAAQLISKAYLRTMKIENLREIIAEGGKLLDALVMQMSMRQRFQGIEGIDMIDSTDDFETNTYTFAGLADILGALGQQLAGAIEIPLVRLFGQEPGGLGNDGESALNTYYDGINQRQVVDLLVGVTTIYRLQAQSLKIKLPDDYALEFRPLWQLKEDKKAEVADKTTTTVLAAKEAGLVSDRTALKELKQSSAITGIWSNITDEEIEAASDEAVPAAEEVLPDAGGLPTERPMPGAPQDPRKPDGQSTAKPEPEAVPAAKPAKTKDSLSAVGHLMRLHGLHVVVENPKGSLRRGVAADTGQAWETQLPEDYGYLRRSLGADGDEVDCFVGPDPAAEKAYVVDQKRLDTGGFDEHKVLLGFPDRDAALTCYRAAYSDGRAQERIGSVAEMNMPQLQSWLRGADLTKPASGFFRYGRAA